MLNIRNPRAAEPARALANALEREAQAIPLGARLGVIIDDYIRPENLVGRDRTKDEIDAMWGRSRSSMRLIVSTKTVTRSG